MNPCQSRHVVWGVSVALLLVVGSAFGADVPFPHTADLMPTYPADLEGSWIEGALNVSYARECLEEKGIAWTSWDYTGGFGLFGRDGSDSFQHDLNVPLVVALGLVAPEQTEFVMEPETRGFALYTDYIASGVQVSSDVGAGAVDYYDVLNPAEDQHCLSWVGSSRYRHVGFDFTPNKD